MNMTNIKSYLELVELPTYIERFKYLQLNCSVGRDTFGYSRYLNQKFYNSPEWRRFRRDMFIRDMGCDLGVPGYEIDGPYTLHHINPITIEDIADRKIALMDPNNVIVTTLQTHNAIHYGDETLLFTGITERSPNDTCPWKL